MSAALAAAILAGLLQTGWTCAITDPDRLDLQLDPRMPTAGMITAVAKAAGCARHRNWRRF